MSEDIHALSGAYAVDALDGQEREAFERHLDGCDPCQAEVASLQEAAATLAETVSLTPPAALRAKTLDSIRRVRPLPPVVRLERRRVSRRTWLSGALVVAAAIALFVVWTQPYTSTPSAGTLSAAEQIVHAGDVVKVSQRLPSGATVVWYRSARLNGAAISTTNLPMPGDGKTYELWLESRDGAMHPAGLLQGGTQTVVLTGAAQSAVGAGLTVEPAGGSATPTLPAVTLAAFPVTH